MEEDDPGKSPTGDDKAPRAILAMSFLAAALFSIASWLAWISLVDLTETMRTGASLDLVSITACKLVASLGFIFVIARLYARDLPLRALLGLRPLSFPMGLLALVAAIAVEMPIAWLERFWAVRFPLTEEQTGELEKLLATETTASKVALVVCVAVLWPIAQELFYRGALYGRLRVGHDARTVAYAVAAFYALSIGSPRGLPSAAIVGLGLSAIRATTGSTWAALIAHVAFMGAAVARSFLGPPDEALAPKHAIIGAVVALVCVVLVRALSTRDVRAVTGRAFDVVS